MIGNNKKTILITGINGFLGSHLAKRLSSNYNIIGTEYQIHNLFRLEGYNFNVIPNSLELIEKLFDDNKVDLVIHTATFYGRDNEDTSQITETNFIMPFYLLNLAIKNKAHAFINTDTVLEKFVSSYALTKNQFREWLYFRQNEIKVINMQLEHFYGPGCSDSNFIIAMIKRLKSNESSIDLTEGRQLRDFIYYEDVINAFELVINKIDYIVTSYTNYQVGSTETIPIKEIVLFLKEALGSTVKLNFGAIPYRENELMVSTIDIEPLRKLGWVPKYTIKKGLLKTISEL